MPTLRNPKHEKFAQLVASGMTAQAAFTQAGYPSPQNAPRLRNNELVAKRIEELQARNERKAEMAALTRDEPWLPTFRKVGNLSASGLKLAMLPLRRCRKPRWLKGRLLRTWLPA